MRKSFYIIATLILATGVLAEVNWEVVPESTNVVSKDPVQLKITATWSGYETISVRTPRLKELKGALIQDIVSYNESKPGQGGVQHTATYLVELLITNAPGTVVETGLIEVMSRGLEDSEFTSSELAGVSLNVRSSKLPWLIPGAAVLVALCAAAVFLFRKRSSGKAGQVSERNLEEEYLSELEESKELRLKGEQAAYFGKCESLIRSYLRAKYSVADLDSFSEKKAQENGVDHRMIRTAKDICALAFNVRYANYEPSAMEEKRAYDFLRELLIRNKPSRQKETDELYIKEEKL
ncbi:hypothetical protein J6T93_05000 [bacterium]|nr:hypothetical protein [bacterium]